MIQGVMVGKGHAKVEVSQLSFADDALILCQPGINDAAPLLYSAAFSGGIGTENKHEND